MILLIYHSARCFSASGERHSKRIQLIFSPKLVCPCTELCLSRKIEKNRENERGSNSSSTGCAVCVVSTNTKDTNVRIRFCRRFNQPSQVSNDCIHIVLHYLMRDIHQMDNETTLWYERWIDEAVIKHQKPIMCVSMGAKTINSSWRIAKWYKKKETAVGVSKRDSMKLPSTRKRLNLNLLTSASN